MLADGTVTSATLFNLQGTEGWHPLSELETLAPRAMAAAGIGAPAPVMPPARLPSEMLRKGSASFESRMLDVFLPLLFITGVSLAVYFGLFFETARDDVHNVGLLNDRLVGVIGGSALAIVACLLKILRRLPAK